MFKSPPTSVASARIDRSLGTATTAFSSAPLLGYAMFQALMRGIGQTQIPLLIVLGTVVLNFALDPLFIFGWGPLPGQGVIGAALATLATQALAALLGIVIFLRGRHGIQLAWRGLAPDFPYLKRAFFLGFPASVELSTRALGL